MTFPDPAVQAQLLIHRFISNGVPLEDFNTTVTLLEDWPGWYSAWATTADARMKDAVDAENTGALRTAAELRLIAALEYHFGKFLFVHDQDVLRAGQDKVTDAYRQAIAHLQWPGRIVGVNHNDAVFPGVLRVPDEGEAPWPTVLVVPGLDAAKEEMHDLCEVFLGRGMATFVFDGPGQGESEFDHHLVADWEDIAASAVATLNQLDEVDGDRLAVVGVSLGGYFAARAAARTPGLRAGVSIGGCYSMAESWPNLSFLSRQAFQVRSGAADEQAAAQNAVQFGLGHAPAIRDIPFLVLHGARDRLFEMEQAKRITGHFGNQAELVVEPEGNHVLHNLAYRVRPFAADWVARKLDLHH